MIRRPPRSTQSRSSAASDVYKRQQGLHVNLSGYSNIPYNIKYGKNYEEVSYAVVLPAEDIPERERKVCPGEIPETGDHGPDPEGPCIIILTEFTAEILLFSKNNSFKIDPEGKHKYDTTPY